MKKSKGLSVFAQGIILVAVFIVTFFLTMFLLSPKLTNKSFNDNLVIRTLIDRYKK